MRHRPAPQQRRDRARTGAPNVDIGSALGTWNWHGHSLAHGRMDHGMGDCHYAARRAASDGLPTVYHGGIGALAYGTGVPRLSHAALARSSRMWAFYRPPA